MKIKNEKLAWSGETNKGETVNVFKNLNEKTGFKWTVKSGKLYVDSYYSTKKTAIEFAKLIIETYNKKRKATA